MKETEILIEQTDHKKICVSSIAEKKQAMAEKRWRGEAKMEGGDIKENDSVKKTIPPTEMSKLNRPSQFPLQFHPDFLPL